MCLCILLNGRVNLLCFCSLTGGMGTAGLSTPVVIPTVSVLGAAPAAAPLLHPTVPGLGSIPGATLPITTPSIDLAPPSECLLLKNMFDPALEVRISLHYYAKSFNCCSWSLGYVMCQWYVMCSQHEFFISPIAHEKCLV